MGRTSGQDTVDWLEFSCILNVVLSEFSSETAHSLDQQDRWHHGPQTHTQAQNVHTYTNHVLSMGLAGLNGRRPKNSAFFLSLPATGDISNDL